MAENRPTICLNMIVRNEAHVIRRCLDSVRPLIDTWVIVDTGSTDGTQDVIREHLRDLPGTLYERAWKGFGASRSEAIELARGSADYLFFIDADDRMDVGSGFVMPQLTEDHYEVEIRHGPLVYWRPALVATRLDWRWVGVLHEYLDCDAEPSRGRLHGVRMLYMSGGGRSQVDQRTKYLRDAEVLEKALIDEPENARYVFYLAQSYRDASEPEQALAAYDRRATMGGFDEEVFCAHLNGARLAAALGRPEAEIVDRYLRAHQSRPVRAEALGELARRCREQGPRWPLAYLFGKAAAAIPRPTDDILFVEHEWYDWRALDEYAVAAYWVGGFQESNDAGERLLAAPGLPETQRARVIENLDFARQKLGRPAVST